jgi:acetyl esterase/lipase
MPTDANSDPEAATYLVRPGVTYGTAGAGGRELHLDLLAYRPGDRRPGVVFIHGGGWRTGERSMMAPHASALAAHGYVAATISYRLVDEAPWPAPLEDAKCALRWMRAHADEIGLDPDRLAVAGGSAGGHLAAMVALTPGRFEGTGGWTSTASSVQAAVYFNPVLDVRGRGPAEDRSRRAGLLLLGHSDARAEAEASPITHIAAGAPPLLTRVGDQDTVAPAARAADFHRALDAAGVPNELEIVPGATHGLPVSDPEGCSQATIAFLAEWL